MVTICVFFVFVERERERYIYIYIYVDERAPWLRIQRKNKINLHKLLSNICSQNLIWLSNRRSMALSAVDDYLLFHGLPICFALKCITC